MELKRKFFHSVTFATAFLEKKLQDFSVLLKNALKWLLNFPTEFSTIISEERFRKVTVRGQATTSEPLEQLRAIRVDKRRR